MKRVNSIISFLVVSLGVILLAVGFVLLFIPGHGLPLIIIGLIILAGYFVWAKRLLNKVKKESKKISKNL